MPCTHCWLSRVFMPFAVVVSALFGSRQPVAAQEQVGGEQVAQEESSREQTAALQSAEDAAAVEAIAQAEEEGFVRLAEEVSVTGSLIPRKDLESLSPVSVVTAEEVVYQGTSRIEDLIQAFPQIYADQNSTIANGASGTATVQLRHLGAVRTLALINGRRMAAGSATWPNVAPDLNSIPSALVKRVDVLTGGASSVYGADAVSGVVNFILDTEFEGVRGSIQYNAFQHDNNNATAQAMNAAVGFPVPSGSTWDSGSFNANVAVGGKLAGGKGHVTAYVDYRHIQEILKERRDYTNCASDHSLEGPICSGSSTTPQGRFFSFGPNWNQVGDYVLDLATGNTFKPFEEERFNYGPYNHMQRPDRKWSGGAFARYTVNEHFEPYAEIMFMDDYTDAQIAPTGTWGAAPVINCDNPMLSVQQRDLLCVQPGYGPNDYANVATYRRNVEGGPRADQIGHVNSRLLAGFRGDINAAWSYDVYGLHAKVSSQQSYINDFNGDRVSDALDVVGDPNDPSTWRCRSGNPGCVPWNIFQVGGVTQGAVDYMSTTALKHVETRTQMLNATLTGDLESYGVAFPSASEGVQVALGAEYRDESLRFSPDEVFEQGTSGQGGSQPGIEGGFNVRELFVEALVPVVQDTRGAEDLTLELGYRYAHYNLSGGNSSYKALLSWAPISSLKLRTGYNRAVRAPNAMEMFEQQGWAQAAIDICENDPDTGVPSATVEECQRAGLSPSQYGTLPGDQFGWGRVLFGGNPDLEVERADTFTLGFVWTPDAIAGLSATIDYYDIQVEDTIGFLWADDIIERCAATGDPLLCSFIHRDAAGSLWLLGDGYVDMTNQNIGRIGARGIDVSASYPWNLWDAGFVNLSLIGTYTLEKSLSDRVSQYDCAGYYGNQCGQPNTRWRHRFRASWQTGFDTTMSLGWRFIGSSKVDDASPEPDLGDPEELESWRASDAEVLKAYSFFDLAATYSFRDGLRLTLGVNNILDTDPPLTPGAWDNDYGPGFYGTYDPLGRTIYTNLQFEF